MRARARAFHAAAAAMPAELANEDAAAVNEAAVNEAAVNEAAVNEAAPNTTPRARRLARTAALPRQRLEVMVAGDITSIMSRSSGGVNEIV